jgi:glycosyltransferase involved in cell wall biosynthesis
VAQVGRLAVQKDYPTFLRAAALIAAELPDVDFLVVGEGERRAELEALARRLGLAGRLRFTGLVHDVPGLLRQVDVLALTSTYEGFPNVIVEAMATGAVAVASDVGGCRELIVHHETGLLVPSQAPAAVAAAALRVLRDPSLARQMALAARRRVESELRVERMVERTTAAYLDLLHARRPPAAVAAA